MSGKRLGSFRSGDRSEYLAGYALSRIAFVNAFPRQEDFGIADFLCVLTKQEGQLVFPESAFYVQVKSDTDDVVLDSDALRWISEYMDHPLLICVANKKTNRIMIYSCWSIWRVMFPQLVARRVNLVLGGDLPLGPPDHLDNAGHYRLCVGPPIIEKSLDELESDPDFCHAILKEWLYFDAQNIARRRIGRIAIAGTARWKTNTRLSESSDTKTLYFFGGDYRLAEKDLTPILTALAQGYRHNKQRAKLDTLCKFLAEIPEHLDDHGQKFARGELRVDSAA